MPLNTSREWDLEMLMQENLALMAEVLAYREVAQSAIQAVAEQYARARDAEATTATLREELRRYTAGRVSA